MDISIGTYLKNLRISCGYTLRAAAKRTNLSHGYIRDVELGSNRTLGSAIIPMPQTLRKFSKAYNASFNELMRIAGHIHTEPETNFEFIEVDLSTILYIEVDTDNHIIYHKECSYYVECKTLHDYILFEEKLERNGFLRLKSGLFANVSMIKAYDKNSGKLYFSESMEGKFVKIKIISGSNNYCYLKLILR